MYLDFFKFKREPFHITPDPEFLFLSRSHQEASASIFYGIEQRKGFIAITGEVGVGKTTILRSYLEGTDPGRIKIIYIFNSTLSFKNLLRQILSELGIEPEDGDSSELIIQLFEYLIQEYRKDRNVVLIIDEAQNMSVETLEKLRMLSNLETSRDKLVQIVLVGQPEFENKLELTELRQLKQRIAIRCKIDSLSHEESLAYIQHRIMKASSFHNTVFTKGALKKIIKAADGIPRTINILCDNALITAFGYQRNPVDSKTVKEVISDMKSGSRRRGFRWKPALAAAIVLIAGYFLFCLAENLSRRGILPSLALSSGFHKSHVIDKTSSVAAPDKAPPDNSSPVQSPPPSAGAPTEVGGQGEAPSGGSSGLLSSTSVPPSSGGEIVEGPLLAQGLTSPMSTPFSAPGGGQDKTSPQRMEGGQIPRDPIADEAVKDVPGKNPSTAQPEARLAAASPLEQNAGIAVGEKKPRQAISPSESDSASKERLAISEVAPYRTRIIKKGECILPLLIEVYGRMDPQIIKAFREINPQITDLDRVKAGIEVFLPNLGKVGNLRGSQDELNRRN